ncbi:MAG: DNA polymerase III subunit epsilon [Gammaproteobacteria bacterium]|uniref:DNA polymerase III subunit epsilon n=1 Tax=Rhodoferax sp. TaxID=50421 RepID=UPI0018393E84|nr:DNA polymerase III subunit epsilon [Rhodoferax sp.]MBU3899504.1 DNA polymerase III subunit epsilon [Gammaproteobacteria bacterium]MBA3059574.1 DNA polymerase III subunit epsilon [Rhodoferax sp.]MBU3998683.1 DNA polymerase III subunit epsilon [Gammaproteobacteria bacterium]MBU4017980.1 DNA polymerase III subunit epsilon [Gammaproteobacteria bacterium]MBU4080330.1 DNA polymerase III subunit epsilon [Gammaproteobacteria bacterium]
MRQIFLDTETTGLSADNGDRIIEIGCVELFKRKLTGNNKHFYLNPGRESHEEALRVHGITSEFLKDKPKFEAVVDELLAYVKNAEIIIHNAPFDLGFLNKELALLGRPRFRECVTSVTDTLVMAKEMFPGKRNSLNALCDRLGVDNSGRALHGALLDAELLADVYINLTRGQDALLMDAGAPETQGPQLVQIDLSRIALPVLAANDQEVAAHDEILKQIDKACGNKTVWRKLA